MYVCPVCKGSLDGLRCAPCAIEFDRADGVPVFFTSTPTGNRYREIARFYDGVYQSRHDVWNEVVGRTPAFNRYVASLVESFGPARYLDVGCGEGFLLSAVSAPEKFGMDLSRKAIAAAAQKTPAICCQGFTECLPYPKGYFDVVSNVGVMEHFIEDVRATREIHRVLRAGGHYVLVLLVDEGLTERIMVKVSQFVYPRFRPGPLVRWALNRWVRGNGESGRGAARQPSVIQPVQNRYTPWSASRLLKRAGFNIARVITKRRAPDAPLPGHFMRIYVLRK